MKKKLDNRQRFDEEMFRGPRKLVEKAPKNPKRKIFEEIEEEEELEGLFDENMSDNNVNDDYEEDENR